MTEEQKKIEELHEKIRQMHANESIAERIAKLQKHPVSTKKNKKNTADIRQRVRTLDNDER